MWQPIFSVKIVHILVFKNFKQSLAIEVFKAVVSGFVDFPYYCMVLLISVLFVSDIIDLQYC